MNKKKKEKSITPFFHSLLTSTRESRTKDGRNIEVRDERFGERERKRKYLNGVNEKVPKEEILVGFP